MEIKEWSYEDFPEFTEEIEGVGIIHTTGDEIGARYIHHVEYANVDGVPLHLQILVPFSRNTPEKVCPCVAFVQGSAWMEQDVFKNVPLAARLAEKGYVVAIVEYRHSGIASFPAQAIDARNAVRFLRKHAEEYWIDPDQIILTGCSSGGHTAVYAGILHNDDTPDNLFPGVSGEVKGIIDYYGSVSVMPEDANPTTLNHHLPDSPEGMEMGGANLRERMDLRRKLSLEHYITQETEIAPLLIFHGTKDRTVNAKVSAILYRSMKAAGKDVRFYLVQGADHGGPEFWSGGVLETADSFIRECLAAGRG